MSGGSSSPGEWWQALEAAPQELFAGPGDPDDPRLGEVVVQKACWGGRPPTLQPGQPVLLGFACDEGVRRNRGRPGAADAPDAIRAALYRFTAWDPGDRCDLAAVGLVDAGNLRPQADLEAGQRQLGRIVAALMKQRAVPIILGGGHETAYGHYIGYAEAGIACAVVNFDAHLDVRPYPQGAHSGSPFRQAIEHPTHPLADGRYVVFGAQRHCVARAHAEFLRYHGHRIFWLDSDAEPGWAERAFVQELVRCEEEKTPLMLSVDADAFRQADVPGVSAPSPVGFDGALWPRIAYFAGLSPMVKSLDLVEVNPLLDRDGQTARWAALGIRQFLVGLAARSKS